MAELITNGLARMRLDEINARLSDRMQSVTSRTGVDFTMMFAKAVAKAVQTKAADEIVALETDELGAVDSVPEAETDGVTAQPVTAGQYDKNAYIALIEQIASEYGLDPALIIAVVQAESDYDPYAVSPKGAMGLMQLMPATAAGLGVNDPYDPYQNIDGGVRYLLGQIIRFDGDFQMALAAYNCGPYGVTGRGINDLNDPAQRALLPTETQNYLDTIGGILTTMGRGDLLEENYYA